MRYLITGGKGFLGSHLSERLLKNGDEVVSLDLSNPKNLDYLNDWKSYQHVTDTIMNSSIINRLIDNCDAVLHLAAIAEPEQYVKNPRKTIEINLRASLNILDRMISTKKLFFYSSTSEIYGKNLENPFHENSDRVLGPTSVNRWSYSTSKAMIEHYCRALYNDKLINYVGIRIFNCYGPRLKGRVLSKFFEKIKNNEPLIIHGDGLQKRCYTYVDDVVEGIFELLNNKKSYGDFFNIGNPKEEYSVKELANLLLKAMKKENYPINYVDRNIYGKSYEDPERRVPDISKIQSILKWKPAVSLHEGLYKIIDYNLEERKLI